MAMRTYLHYAKPHQNRNGALRGRRKRLKTEKELWLWKKRISMVI